MKPHSVFALLLIAVSVLAISLTGASSASRTDSGFAVSSSIDGSKLDDQMTLSGQVTWTASSGGTPNRIEFLIDGTSKWTDPAAPYQFGGDPTGKFDTTSLLDGQHKLTVKAYRDAGNNHATSQSVTVTISNGKNPPPPPSSSFVVTSSVADGATLTGSLTWTATPSGTTVSSVDFLIDGTVKWTEHVSPYVFNGDGGKLDTTTLSNGAHTLALQAHAADGRTATTTSAVTVANGATTPPPPPPSSGSGVATSATTYQIPSTIAGNCSADVTQQILAWIASVPDNSILSFTSGGCYRIEGTLELTNRNGLTFEGNGSTFKATTVGDGHRPQWRLVEGSNFVLRNMTIDGGNPQPGTFNANLQWSHGIELMGPAGVDIDHVSMTNVYGDCVYVGQGYYSKSWSSTVHVHDGTCTRSGRMGIAITAGRNVLVERNSISQIGMTAFDVEPNGTGFGAQNVTFTNNQVRSDDIFDATGDGPVDTITVSNNTITGVGTHMVVLAPQGQRRSNITVTGNTSDTGYYAAGGVAMDFVRVDGLTVTNNVMPLSGPNMALADVSEACNVNISGNSYPGGVIEARIHPYDCGSQAAPTISSFTPTSGPVGTSVTITGTGFTGTTAVAFNGTLASFTVNSATQITATTPSAATTGPLRVTTPAGTKTSSNNFTVTAAAPTISSFTPTSGPVGTSVTITGTGFTGTTAVAFNGTLASFTVNSATQITATTPSAATTGPLRVTTPAGTKTSSNNFTVTAAAPTISSFTPTSGPVGTSVTITGTGFTGTTAVAFNGTLASFTVNSATQITATTPSAATTGPLRVTTPAGTKKSSKRFRVTSR